jgi:hypothetical protein
VQLKPSVGYEGGIVIGQRKLFVFPSVGPTSYSQTTGDVVVAPVGVYIDYIAPTMSVSKTYEVRFFPSAVNTTRATWTAKWYVISSGAEVGNAVNLSGESIQTLAVGGEF